jgi:hypothetical protein
MAGKSNTSATFFAQKKLLGKAHTSNLKVDGEEVIGSNIQAASSLIFGEEIPTSPSQTLYLLQSASNGGPSTVEYIHFSLGVLTGTTYDADSSGGGAGSDSGENAQSSGPHTYKFALGSDYQVSSSNPNKGQGIFDNNKIIHHALGSLQLIPPFFSQDAPNPYVVKIFKDDGSGGIGDEIPLLDNVDWNVDYYNGILFLQDYDSGKIPAHAKAFAYVGKMLNDVVSSGTGGSGDTAATYLVKTATGSLSAERVLTGGSGIKTADAGANSSFTLSVDNSIVATLTGSQFSGNVGVTGSLGSTTVITSPAFSGSLTRLTNGSSFITAGSNISITSSSIGQIVVAASAAPFTRTKTIQKVTSHISENTTFTLTGSDMSVGGFDPNYIDLFVNGQLLLSGTQTQVNNSSADYTATGNATVKFAFPVDADDLISIIIFAKQD